MNKDYNVFNIHKAIMTRTRLRNRFLKVATNKIILRNGSKIISDTEKAPDAFKKHL